MILDRMIAELLICLMDQNVFSLVKDVPLACPFFYVKKKLRVAAGKTAAIFVYSTGCTI